MSEQTRTFLAVGLMGLILLLFFSDWYQEMINPGSTTAPKPNIESSFSSTDEESTQPDNAPPPVVVTETEPRDTETVIEAPTLPTVGETSIIVSTPHYDLHFSNLGAGTLQRVYLKDYHMKDSSQVQLISDMAEGVLANQFIGFDVEDFSTRDMPALSSLGTDALYEFPVYGGPASFSFELIFPSGASLVRTFTFYPDSFHFDLDQELINFDRVNAGRFFATSWSGGIAPTEKNRKDDLYYSEMYALLGDDSSPTDYSADEDRETEVQSATTSWVATRSKYFTAILIPDEPVNEFKSVRYQTQGSKENSVKIFDFDVRDSFDRRQSVSQSNYRVYLGPLAFDNLKEYGLHLEEMMNWGWFGIIGKGALWVFKFLYRYIPNYGLVLILFSILVKLLVAPLTKKQMDSTINMQAASPQIAALKEKFKDDPKKLNEETMKLYKELGVNPLGGCLPLLIQMPILIAMFNLFRTTIQLRGAAFKGLEFWIPDLSLPDTVGQFMGFDINLLPIIMSVTMILQQKLMAPPTANANPQMKNMPYIMTAVFFFMFYTFPSGLNLYYTLFNLMSIAQQKLFSKPALALAPVPVAPTAKPGKKQKKK